MGDGGGDASAAGPVGPFILLLIKIYRLVFISSGRERKNENEYEYDQPRSSAAFAFAEQRRDIKRSARLSRSVDEISRLSLKTLDEISDFVCRPLRNVTNPS